MSFSRRFAVPLVMLAAGCFVSGCGGDSNTSIASVPINSSISSVFSSAGAAAALQTGAVPSPTAPAPTLSATSVGATPGRQVILGVTSPTPATDVLISGVGLTGLYDVSVLGTAVLGPQNGPFTYQIFMSFATRTTPYTLTLSLVTEGPGFVSAPAFLTVNVSGQQLAG